MVMGDRKTEWLITWLMFVKVFHDNVIIESNLIKIYRRSLRRTREERPRNDREKTRYSRYSASLNVISYYCYRTRIVFLSF